MLPWLGRERQDEVRAAKKEDTTVLFLTVLYQLLYLLGAFTGKFFQIS